ncbi:hypothetical protein D3C85_1699170 [compost metagenome]
MGDIGNQPFVPAQNALHMSQSKIIDRIYPAFQMLALYFLARNRGMDAMIVSRAEVEHEEESILIGLHMRRMAQQLSQ